MQNASYGSDFVAAWPRMERNRVNRVQRERFEIFTCDNRGPIGQEARDVVHARGLWHRGVHVFVCNSRGQLLLQQRATDKDVCPGLWDLSVAEHLQPGESWQDAARRGLREELGIDAAALELRPVGVEFRSSVEIFERGIFDHEFQRCFEVTYDGAFELDGAEVAAAQFFELEAVEAAMTQQPQQYTPWFRACWASWRSRAPAATLG